MIILQTMRILLDYELWNISADNLVHAIKDTLLHMNLSLAQYQGQCYDGASNMRSRRSGVSQVLSEEKRVLYTHYYGHALNFAVDNCYKAVQDM